MLFCSSGLISAHALETVSSTLAPKSATASLGCCLIISRLTLDCSFSYGFPSKHTIAFLNSSFPKFSSNLALFAFNRGPSDK